MMTGDSKNVSIQSPLQYLLTQLKPLSEDIIIAETFQHERYDNNQWSSQALINRDPLPYTGYKNEYLGNSFPKDIPAYESYEWIDSWRPDLSYGSLFSPFALEFTRGSGWIYAPSFRHIQRKKDMSIEHRISYDTVRQRRWIRRMKRKIIAYEWKEEKLGVSLVQNLELSSSNNHEGNSTKPADEPVKTYKDATIVWESGHLGITLCAAGANELPMIKRFDRQRQNLEIGQVLWKINNRTIDNLRFTSVMKYLNNCAKPCTLYFRQPQGSIVVKKCSSVVRRLNIQPGDILVGLNHRQISDLTLVEIETLLRKLPRHSIVLHFSPASKLSTSTSPSGVSTSTYEKQCNLNNKTVQFIKENTNKENVKYPKENKNLSQTNSSHESAHHESPAKKKLKKFAQGLISRRKNSASNENECPKKKNDERKRSFALIAAGFATLFA